MWAILDKVVDDYVPVVEGIDNDIEEVEQQIFTRQGEPDERIYFLKREVIEFHRASHPARRRSSSWTRRLPLGRRGLQSFFRDVADHAASMNR